MWITICFLGVLIIGGIVFCVTSNIKAFEVAATLDLLIGIGYFISKMV